MEAEIESRLDGINKKLRTTKVLQVVTGALSLITLAAVGDGIYFVRNQKISPVWTTTEDSPIIVAGGSISVHADQGWEDTLAGGTIDYSKSHRANIDLTQLRFRYVADIQSTRTVTHYDAPPLEPGWILYLCTRDPLTGSDNPTLKVATDRTACDGFVIESGDSSPGQITLRRLQKGNSTFLPSTPDAGIDEHANGADGKVSRKFRFGATGFGCSAATGEFCDQIGYILLVDKTGAPKKQLRCFEGECRIFVGGKILLKGDKHS